MIQFLSEWWPVVFAFAAIGIYESAERLWYQLRPPKPPKVRKYRISVHDPEGYPMRSFGVKSRQMAKLTALIDHFDKFSDETA